jgi:arabinofuranan 3-O-arabinosyltransferase
VHVVDAEPANDVRFDDSTRSVPVGISEILLTGLPYLPVALPTDPIETACGTGPDLEVNGTQVSTRVVGAPADLFAGEGGEAVPCGTSTVALAAGPNSVEAIASDAFVVDAIVLGAATQAPTEGLEVSRSSPVAMGTEMDSAGPLVTHMNVNPGWQAERSGAELEPAVFDGWRQGWLSRDGGTVEARFGPDLGYRFALALGLLGVLLLLFIALRRPGRDAPEMRAIHSRPVSGLWLATGVLASGALLAGPGGLGTAAAALGAGMWLHRRSPGLGGAWAAVLLIPAGGAYFFRPWGSASVWAGYLDWPQLLVLAACCAAAGWVAADFGVPRWPRRTPGSSTRR